MKPAPFEYVAAQTVEEAVDALGDDDSRALAGGQSLVPLMNLRLARPATLVDVNGLSDLDHVTADGDEVRLGALCRHRSLELDPAVREAAPLVAQAAALIGHPQVRNRGTLGGSVAHADPAAELAAALLALEGRVRVTGPGGEREVAAGDLFEGYFTTSLAPGELLVEVVVPTHQPGDGTAFVEFAPRHGDFAVAGVAARVSRPGGGACTHVRLAGCGLASRPVDLSSTAAGLVGSSDLAENALRQLAEGVTGAFEPTDDIHASAADRVELAQLLSVQAVRQAWSRATNGSGT